MIRLKIWAGTALKIVWGMYFTLTSVYCLLAFLPYTYYALIKAPAYEWMPWFVHHHAGLYWMSYLLGGVAFWRQKRTNRYLALFGLLGLFGIYVTIRPFVPGLENNAAAYIWSLLSLAPLMWLSLVDLTAYRPAQPDDHNGSLPYSSAVLVAIFVSLLYVAGAQLRTYGETRSLRLHASDLELTFWSLVTHVVLALILLTLLNLIRVAARKTSAPTAVRSALNGLLAFVALWIALERFLGNALSFEGWQANLYAASLAASLTVLGFSLVAPFRARETRSLSRAHQALWIVAAAALAMAALALPSVIHNSDWNGVLEATFTLAFWVALSVCIFKVRPQRGKYSIAAIAAVLLIAGFTYKALQFSAIIWAKPLGSTEDEISRSLESYAGQDASFQLAHHLLGNSRTEDCADLCRILREYSNIREAHLRADITLVGSLVAVQAEKPNIFIFVIDSLRPDYLGAYNPNADFTPNLDAFARDSIAFHLGFTQYAGTTLSEPAIWSGAMLLHTHYLQPFSKVNGLEKLAKTDGYQMIVSYDTVLSQLLSPSDDLIKLDTDKSLWNRFEVCSTIQQTEQALDTRRDKSRPVLFYAQPMNVHQFAHNDLPLADADHWRTRPEFNNRIAHEVYQVDECIGRFFNYLRSRGLYDKSIIILTSDHGDATGEFGRFSHSVSLFPEIMRVPLIVHLPADMRQNFVHDDSRITTLTDITPSLYYLLGHRPIRQNPLFGRPLFAQTKEELDGYQRDDYFLASDVRAAYGILADNGRFLYFTYDSPPESFLYDLGADPKGEKNVVTDALKRQYDQRIIEHLQAVADFYGYKPGVGSLLASSK